MFIKAKESHEEFAIVSADALWVPYYHQQGLSVPFDIRSFPVSKQLYSASLDVPFWKSGGGYLAYPRAWSALRIYYNPKYVNPAPTSWEVLLDPKYKGKFVRENQPTDIVAEAGLATGAKDPYNMNTAELSKAKQFLQAAKPAFLDLVSQNTGRRHCARERDRVVHLGEPRHGYPRQEGRWADDQGGHSQGGRGRVAGCGDEDDRAGREPVRAVHQRLGAGRVDPAAVQGVRGGVVQREGLQAAREPGAEGSRGRRRLQRPRGRPEGAPQGTAEEPRRIHCRSSTRCSARSRTLGALVRVRRRAPPTLPRVTVEALSPRTRQCPGPAGRPVQVARPRPLARISQYLGFAPAAVLFGVFFGAPMVMIVLVQLLDAERVHDRGSLDVRELPVGIQHPCLCRHLPDDAVDDRGGDARDARDRLSVRLLARALREPEVAAPAPVPRDHPVLGELPAAGHLVDDHPGKQGRARAPAGSLRPEHAVMASCTTGRP